MTLSQVTSATRLIALLCCMAFNVVFAIEPININTASAEEIAAAISGVGEKRAERIVEYRERFGPFASVEELANVDGIGISTVEKNRDKIAVD